MAQQGDGQYPRRQQAGGKRTAKSQRAPSLGRRYTFCDIGSSSHALN
jgi:hypothetical protein